MNKALIKSLAASRLAFSTDLFGEPIVGNISGHLLSPAGSAVSGVQVVLFDTAFHQFTETTQADGSFSFTVPAGNWSFYIPPEQTPNLIRPTFSYWIAQTTNISNVEAKLLFADAVISGNIKDPYGQPVANISVSASRFGTDGISYYIPAVQTDGAGNFTIAANKGPWFVDPDCANLLSLSFDCASGLNVDASAGAATANFSLTTGPQPTIESPRIEFSRVGDFIFDAVLIFTLRGAPGGYDIQSRKDVPLYNYSWPDVDFVAIPTGSDSVEVRYHLSLAPTLPYPTLPSQEFIRIRRRLAAP